jgi:hypothetical protein
VNVSSDLHAASASLPGPGPRLERVIGVGGLGSSAVNCIVGSGIFGLPGIAAAMLGPATRIVSIARQPSAVLPGVD